MISEKTKKSLLKSVIEDSYQLCELRKSILLDEDFEYLTEEDEKQKIIPAPISNSEGVPYMVIPTKPFTEKMAEISDRTRKKQAQAICDTVFDDHPTADKRFGDSRDEEVAELAMKNRKMHSMEIHEQIRTALMNCREGWDVDMLLIEIEVYERKVKYDGDGHPYNLDKVIDKIYKDFS